MSAAFDQPLPPTLQPLIRAAGVSLLALSLSGCGTMGNVGSYIADLFKSAPQAQTAARDIPPLALKANAALGQGETEAAVRLADLAVLTDPEHPDAHAALARAQLASGALEFAESSYARAVELSGGRPSLRLGFALAAFVAGEPASGLQTLSALEPQALKSPGESWSGDVGLALVLAGSAERGLPLLEAGARGSQATARTRQNLALGYAIAGAIERARAVAAVDLPAEKVQARLNSWAELAALPPNQRLARLVGVPQAIAARLPGTAQPAAGDLPPDLTPPTPTLPVFQPELSPDMSPVRTVQLPATAEPAPLFAAWAGNTTSTVRVAPTMRQMILTTVTDVDVPATPVLVPPAQQAALEIDGVAVITEEAAEATDAPGVSDMDIVQLAYVPEGDLAPESTAQPAVTGQALEISGVASSPRIAPERTFAETEILRMAYVPEVELAEAAEPPKMPLPKARSLLPSTVSGRAPNPAVVSAAMPLGEAAADPAPGPWVPLRIPQSALPTSAPALSWTVDLGVFETDLAIQQSYAELKRRYGSVVRRVPGFIAAAGDGQRLVLGRFTGETLARGYCAELAAEGVACEVRSLSASAAGAITRL